MIQQRPMIPTDRAFVIDAWRGSFLDGGEAVRYADRDHYKQEMDRLLDVMVHKATVTLACDEQDPDTLCGFVCHTGPELHYVYVKRDFRHMGVARGLIQPIGIKSFTFRTFSFERRIKPSQFKWKFTPRFTFS